ncbi:MAG: EboA domain-containing protein [Planctomycetia bacterium]|nr:EboA domain-containing protein [Planctomycetia bacterium]
MKPVPPALAALERALAGPEEAWIRERLDLDPAAARAALPVVFPALARRAGRAGLSGRIVVGGAHVDLGAWRRCDAVGTLLLHAADPVDDATLVDLFLRGDLEERTILLRAASVRPLGAATSRFLDEVQRTNVGAHLEAACLDHDLLVRALDGGLLSRDRFDRLVLKAAFNDLPLARMEGVRERPGAELTRMLLDLATEREAAGRPVWRDTLRLAGGAPVAGTVARVLGALEHGDATTRLAGAEALLALRRKDLAAYAAERLPREHRPDVRAALERAAAL